MTAEKKPLKQLPYGEARYQEIRFGNYAYVDKTCYIERLEKCGTNFPFIVRPRRFGKSLFTDTLALYYDRAEAGDFEKNFAGTYIGAHKTPLANQFYVLSFAFAGLAAGALVQNFYDCVLSSLNDFFTTYPHPRQREVLEGQFSSAGALVERFFAILGAEFRKKVYVIIDEYDQFANVVLSQDVGEFREITAADGFLKDFYTKLKTAASGKGAVAKVFITGVTSISLDSMTSGFSIATNLTTDPEFAGLYGFSEDEIRRLIPEVLDTDVYGQSAEAIVERMKEWYNGYYFSPDSAESVFNASMSCYYLRALQRLNHEPVTMLDPAFAQDLQKIVGILQLGDPDFVKTVVTKGLQREAIRFPMGDLQLLNLNQQEKLDDDGVLSAMVYLGYLTFAEGDSFSLVVPNRAVAIQFFEYYQQYILATPAFKYSNQEFSEAYAALAAGDPAPLFAAACRRFSEKSGLHTHLHLTESDFQTLIAAALYFTDDFEVEREVEARGGDAPGYIDLLIRPAAGVTAPSYLVELKYLTKKEGTPAAVKAAAEAATAQAERYARCDNIRTIPNLKRVTAIFVGTRLETLDVRA